MAAARSIANVVKKSPYAVPGGLSTTWVTGKKYQLPQIQEKVGEMSRKWKLFLYSQEDYCKVGLLAHDRIPIDESKLAELAWRRMTREQRDGMNYRASQALLLSATKRNLPQEEWTPIDAEHLYLQDVLDQLKSEIFEEKLMKAALNDYNDDTERYSLIPFRLYNYFKIKKTRRELAERYSQPVV